MKRAMTKMLLLGLSVSLLLSYASAYAQTADDEEAAKKYLEEVKAQEEIRRQDRIRTAEYYFESGKKSYEARRFEDAEREFEAAVAANPQHAGAKQYLEKTKDILGKGESGDSILNRERDRELVQLAHQQARMLRAVVDAKRFMRNEDYGNALTKLGEARNLAKVLSTRLEVSAAQAEIEQLTEQASKEKAEAAALAEQEQREQAEKIAGKEHSRLAELQKQRVARLFEDAKELYSDTRYVLALRKAEEVMKLDPRNAEVIAFRDMCYKEQTVADRARYEQSQEEETAATWLQVRNQSIPYTQPQPVYPDNWEEIKKRTAGIEIEQGGAEDADWKRPLEEALAKPISFDFIATPLDDVVAFLRNMMKVNIVVDKNAVEGRDLDVTLKQQDVKFKNALDWIVRLLEMNYTLQDGAIFISTAERIGATKKTTTKFYDVTDLTLEIRDFKPNLAAISNTSSTEDTISDIFGEDTSDTGDEKDRFTGDSLVEFIKWVIAPGTWDEGPGSKDADLGW